MNPENKSRSNKIYKYWFHILDSDNYYIHLATDNKVISKSHTKGQSYILSFDSEDFEFFKELIK